MFTTSAATTGAAEISGSETSAPEARMTRPTRLWVWGWILSFLIHDGEEALYIVRHGGFKEFGVFQTVSQNLIGMMFELAVGWLAILAATRSARPGWPVRVLAVLLWGWTLHGVLHLVQSATGAGYSFGSVTALPVVVVYGCVALGHLYRDRLMQWRWIVPTAVVGAITGFALIYAAHAWGSLIG
jgi:hypothetical protein